MNSNKSFFISLVVVIAVALVLAFTFVNQPLVQPQNQPPAKNQGTGTGIVNVAHPDAVPPAISSYFNLSNDQVYDAQVRTLADGSTQSLVSFTTNDLGAAHTMALDAFTKNGFTVQMDDAESSTFSLSGAKGSERLQVTGFAGNNSSSSSSTAGSVTIIDLR